MEVWSGMGKTCRCEDNRKLGNNDQNQHNIIWDRGKSVTWLVIASQIISILNVLRYESKSNDVQENEDYVEMVQGDMNCISGHPTNMFSL